MAEQQLEQAKQAAEAAKQQVWSHAPSGNTVCSSASMQDQEEPPQAFYLCVVVSFCH